MRVTFNVSVEDVIGKLSEQYEAVDSVELDVENG